MHSFLGAVLSLMIVAAHGPSLAPAGTDIYANPPGWAWLIEPTSPTSTAWSSKGVLGLAGPSFDGGLDVVIALEPAAGSEYRVVAFDSTGTRCELEGFGAGNNKTILRRFRSKPDVLPFSRVVSFGVEVLSSKGWIVASEAAAMRAAAAGIQTLPLPTLEKPYEFELMDVDGHVIRTSDLQGKVIVVDCWATWCAPCMKKMPTLKSLYERWRGRGLAVVGVNFDQDLGKAREAVANLELAWPQVAVPPDREVRRLWQEVSGISFLPRLLVIDRRGVLVGDTKAPAQLEAIVGKALKKGE